VYYKRCLSVKKIEQSLEHADVLNSITEQKSIDDLVSEALQSDIAKNCTCDICEFVKKHVIKLTGKVLKLLKDQMTLKQSHCRKTVCALNCLCV